MVKKIKLEFFPELEHLISEKNGDVKHKQIVVHPTINSLRLYINSRLVKRKIMWTRSTSTQIENVIISFVRKYTGIKSFRRGKKFGARSLPMVTLAGKLIQQGGILNKKEIVKTFDEVITYLLE
jgi:hypothetical protein